MPTRTIDGITVVDQIPAEKAVRATQDFFVDGGFSRPVPGRPISGFGRAIRRGALYRIDDPAVRANIQFFETVSRPLTLEDIDRMTEVK
jgi:hypothetical protein